jgi:hypothetical protein
VNKAIDTLDLSSVTAAVSKRKLLKSSQVSVGEELYRVFLFLKKIYPNAPVRPHPAADIFWHEHILQTKKYHADCKKIFGKYLHHRAETSETSSQIKRAHKKTIELIRKHFLK